MIVLNRVTAGFDDHTLFQDVSLKINPGEFVFLIGPTGSGKSTLLRLLYMDMVPMHGTVAIGSYMSAGISGRQKAMMRRSLGIVFQDYRLFDDRSVFENVAFALEVTGAGHSEIKRKVIMALGDVGLSHVRYRFPHELSGGEQQRVVIARAMVNSPTFLLADEPTGNLDPATAVEILDLLATINRRGTGVIMATHHHDLVGRTGGRVIELLSGKIQSDKMVPARRR